RDRVPFQWAMTQNNVGNVLRILGEREGSVDRFTRAIAAYGEALLERTREGALLDWAATTANLGLTNMMLAGATYDIELADAAISQIKSAMDAIRDSEHVALITHLAKQCSRAEAHFQRLQSRR